jgi:hypothetical protein
MRGRNPQGSPSHRQSAGRSMSARFDEWFEAHYSEWLQTMRSGAYYEEIDQFRNGLRTAWDASARRHNHAISLEVVNLQIQYLRGFVTTPRSMSTETIQALEDVLDALSTSLARNDALLSREAGKEWVAT